MPSAGGPRRSTDIVTLVAVYAATIAARLPFLLRADRFFDSDEAVEGLMARHVLMGERPLFLWGQRYKGVPEIYLSSVVFHVFGSSVVALKAVTLAVFALFVCFNFWLLARVSTRAIAWMATALLVVCPPSLVVWSLSGSAELVMTLAAGSVLCLAIDAWRRSGSRAGLVVGGAAFGFGLWVQQFILYYAAALALTALDVRGDWRERLHALVNAQPTWLRIAQRALLAAAALYVLLGLVAFFSSGLDMTLRGVRITVTHPQKMWWIAGGLLMVAGILAAAGTFRRAVLAPALGFLAGYAPALFGRLSSQGYGSPIGRMDLGVLRSSISPLLGGVVPILFGFKSPATERLAVPAWTALLIATVIVLSFTRMRGRPFTPFFHAFVVVAPVVFVVSGAYIDAQSYRYLMPIYAALPAVYAVGIDQALRWSKAAGSALLAGLLALFTVQQVDWYRRLPPDRDSTALISCLDRSSIRAAYADYWLSYKLTFLTAERIIVAPTNGVDRYAPYSAAVRAQPGAPTLGPLRPGDPACQGLQSTDDRPLPPLTGPAD